MSTLSSSCLHYDKTLYRTRLNYCRSNVLGTRHIDDLLITRRCHKGDSESAKSASSPVRDGGCFLNVNCHKPFAKQHFILKQETLCAPKNCANALCVEFTCSSNMCEKLLVDLFKRQKTLLSSFNKEVEAAADVCKGSNGYNRTI